MLKKYNTFGFSVPVCGPFGDSNIIKSFKYKWFKARSYEWYVENCKNTQYYEQITKFIKETVYEYFINELSHEDGIIMIGYQPIIYGPYQSEIFANTENLYAQEAINYSLLEQFLNEYQSANKNSKIWFINPNILLEFY
uniref:Uncharacterized protein n=1 Tax=Spiroplasma citri TaxID=2133 RepID=Q14LC7_SPICI|nr:hypothetical protein SPICI19_053 [Spiroplasma citri]